MVGIKISWAEKIEKQANTEELGQKKELSKINMFPKINERGGLEQECPGWKIFEELTSGEYTYQESKSRETKCPKSRQINRETESHK